MHNQCAERRRFFAPRGLAGRQQGQVVAALAIRDAVGDAISRRQAAVKPGPWPGRRAARRSALAGALVVPPQRTEPSAGYVHGRTFTWPHVVSVYLYLRRSETGLPLPEAPHASPTSTCAPALRARALAQTASALTAASPAFRRHSKRCSSGRARRYRRKYCCCCPSVRGQRCLRGARRRQVWSPPHTPQPDSLPPATRGCKRVLARVG